MAIPTVTTSDVDSLLSKTEKPLLVYLWDPSAILKTDANIEGFANNCGESVSIVKVDVDKDPELYDRFGIPWVGKVLFFLSGEFRLSLQASTPASLLLQTLWEIK